MKKLLITLLIFFQTATAQETVTGSEKIDPTKILADLRHDLSGMQADFIQYELLESGEKSDINSGQVYMQAPSKFRWQYIEPVEQLIVADGTNVWVYDEDLEQVTVKEQNNEMNPIYVIINDKKSQQQYNIKHEMRSNGLDWISLTPKEVNEEVKTVWLAVKNNTVEQIKVENQFNQTMVFEFHSSLKNPGFDADLFQFVPPEGVDVIRAIAGDQAEF